MDKNNNIFVYNSKSKVNNFDSLYKNINNYNKVKDDKNYEFISRFLNTEPNDVSLIFFSDENITNLNNNIVNNILELTKKNLGKAYRIQPQQKEKMLTVMRYIYFRFNTNTETISEEVNQLNIEFLNEVVPTAYSSLISQIKYLETIETYNQNKNNVLQNPKNTQSDKEELKPLSSIFSF